MLAVIDTDRRNARIDFSALTIIRTMKTLPLADVKAHLSALLNEIESQHGQITVTRNGTPAAVVISVDEWESLQETIAVQRR